MGCGCSQAKSNTVVDSHRRNVEGSEKIKETHYDEETEFLITVFLREVYKNAKSNLLL